MSANLKITRDASIRLLEMRCKTLQSLLNPKDGGALEKRRIKGQIVKLTEEFEKFSSDHSKYRDAANLDGDDKVEDDRVFEKWFEEVDHITDEAEEKLDDSEDQAPAGIGSKAVKSEISALEVIVEDQVKAVETSLTEGDPLTCTTLGMLVSELEKCQVKLDTEIASKYADLCLLQPSEIEATFSARNSFSARIRERIFAAKSTMAQKRDSLGEARSHEPKVGVGSPTPGPVTTHTGGAGSMYYKKRDFPTFSGQLDDYPGFRKRWNATVAPHFSQEHQLDQIVLSLPKKDVTEVKCFTAMRDVWDSLDYKYGRADIAALHFIDKFKKLEVIGTTDHHKFVKLYEQWNTTKFNLHEIGRLDTLKELQSMRETRRKMP